MVSAIGELVGRPFTGLVADKLGDRNVHIVQIGSIITCLAGVYVILSMARVSLLVYGCILGVFGEIHMPLLLPTLLECTSKSHHSIVAVLSCSAIALSGTIGLQLMGKFTLQHTDVHFKFVKDI